MFVLSVCLFVFVSVLVFVYVFVSVVVFVSVSVSLCVCVCSKRRADSRQCSPTGPTFNGDPGVDRVPSAARRRSGCSLHRRRVSLVRGCVRSGHRLRMIANKYVDRINASFATAQVCHLPVLHVRCLSALGDGCECSRGAIVTQLCEFHKRASSPHTWSM